MLPQHQEPHRNRTAPAEQRLRLTTNKSIKMENHRQFALLATNFLLKATLLILGFGNIAEAGNRQQPYYGSLIGPLIGHSHNVSGEVYAVDEQTLFIKDFNYDGQAADAYFWSSAQQQQASLGPHADGGFIVPDEKGSTKPLERYTDKDVVLRLPEGKTLREIGWLSVWSRANKLSSGEVMIGRQLQTPRPLEIGPLSQLAHGLKSGPITIVDAQTFLVPDFHYDGLGPEAYFWLTRGSSGLGPSGLKLKDENGGAGPLRKYSGETVVISLPDELTIHDFDYFGVWCTKFQVNFGQVRIPQAARVPPSPKMLGIKPENKLNCEILYDDLGYEIRWVLDGDDIVMQLVGKIEPGEYMAFGLGKDDSKSDMQNADAVVTWVDRTSGQVHAVDYYLGAKQQCVNEPQRGSCPDSKLPGGGDSLTLLHGAIVNGYSMVTFKRPQLGVDEQYDQHVYSDGQQSVLWAIGTLNKQQEIGYHRLKTRANMFIDFARNPQWNCPIPDLNASMHTNLPIATSASQLDPTVVSSQQESHQPTVQKSTVAAVGTGANTVVTRQQQQQQQQQQEWFIPSLVCPAERTFYAQLGPTGGRKGYEARTGRSGWGLAWYVNGIMIPELVVERGLTYRFVVEGGSDKTSAARRHPFYLTDSAEGGFDFKTDDERLKERIFAGVALRGDGQFVPTAEGRLCEWRPSDQSVAADPDSYPTFAAYQRSLKLDCAPGQAAVLKFTPDASTPDQLYYQCYTHRFMGWRVRVVDSCTDYLSGQQHQDVGLGGQNVTLLSTGLKSSTSKIRSQLQDEKPTYERRYSFGGANEDDLLAAQSSQSLDRILIRAVKGMAEQRQSLFDFGDEAAASALATTELTTFPSDMLILNSSVLNQHQPFNISTIEQILKFSPSDLEFISSSSGSGQIANSDELPPLHSFHSPVPFLPNSLPLQHLNGGVTFGTPPLKTSNSPKDKKKKQNNSNKQQLTSWNSYIRRLASIYYPVQQQLTSMLTSNQNNHGAGSSAQSTQSSNNHLQSKHQGNRQIMSASSEQSNSFSLSNLVPKPKIDLTKSGITKKLNKLRFKSANNNQQKQEKPSQPPTPAIEFNYDIFNNQLAQLEKQQKHIHSMDLLNWPQQQQQAVDQYNSLMSMMPAASVDHQQAINSLPAHLLFGGSGLAESAPSYINEPRGYHNPIQAIRVQVPPHEGQAYRHNAIPEQQHYFGSHGSGRAVASQLRQQPSVVEHVWPSEIQHQDQQQQVRQPVQQHPQEHSVFVARLPHLSYVPAPIQQQHQQQQQQQQLRNNQTPEPANQQHTARYPNIQPYNGASQHHQQSQQHYSHHQTTPNGHRDTVAGEQQQQPASQLQPQHQMSSLPSVALTIHDAPNKQQQPQQQHEEQVDSMSGSSTGSQYEFRQPATKMIQAESGEQASRDNDHMMAIERFSSSRQHTSDLTPTRWPGEYQFHYIDNGPHHQHHQISGNELTASASQHHHQQQLHQAAGPTTPANQSSNNQLPSSQPTRFSNQLIDKNILAPGESLPPEALKLTEERTQELHRVNASSKHMVTQQPEPVTLTSTAPNVGYSARPTTTESAPTTLVEPNGISLAQDLYGLTTAPSVGPLVPSLGPPLISATNFQQQQQHNLINSETVLKSTLVEPISSTLIQSPSPPVPNFVHIDANPFIPMHVKPNLPSIYQHHHHLPLTGFSRFGPSMLVESMFRHQNQQSQAALRPEPPVQVASYLSQHLANHHQSASAVGDKMQSSSSNNNTKSATSDLIILKPTALAKQNPQTYALRPEHYTTTTTNAQIAKLDDSYASASADSHRQTGEPAGGPTRRIAGRQFDRLSSLSSPPSTSIALDPLQTDNSKTSYLKQTNASAVVMRPQNSTQTSLHTQQPIAGGDTLNTTSQQQLASSMQSKLTTIQNERPATASAQHRQSPIPSKPIPLNYESAISDQMHYMSPQDNTVDGFVRLNPGGENTNTLNRNNQTDNAILSHVMSLISSNAIPTPPLIPVASYSSADYFLPISDRIHRSVRG